MLRRSIFCSICNIILVLCISTTSNVLVTCHPGISPYPVVCIAMSIPFYYTIYWSVCVAEIGALPGSTGNVLRVWVQDPHTHKLLHNIA